MRTKPGEVYPVDLGMGGKVRMMMVVSREDATAPRALSICAPITTVNRGSAYEVELPSRPFLRERSYANIQGLQAIQHHELQGPIGIFHGKYQPFQERYVTKDFDGAGSRLYYKTDLGIFVAGEIAIWSAIWGVFFLSRKHPTNESSGNKDAASGPRG